MKNYYLVIILCILFPFQLFGNTQTTIKTNAKDAYISSENDTLNYGTATVAIVGIDTSARDTTRFLYQAGFITSLLPQNAVLDSFTIVFYKCSTATDTNMGSGNLLIHRLDSIFVEGDSNGAVDTLNWNNRLYDRMVNGSGLWATAGGDFATQAVDTVAFTESSDSIVFNSDSLTALVQRWINGTSDNIGFIIKTDEVDDSTTYVFATSDSSGREPVINLWWTVPIVTNNWSLQILTRDSTGSEKWINDYDIDIGNSDTANVALAAVSGGIPASKSDSLNRDEGVFPNN